jgi:hypothetical protein
MLLNTVPLHPFVRAGRLRAARSLRVCCLLTVRPAVRSFCTPLLATRAVRASLQNNSVLTLFHPKSGASAAALTNLLAAVLSLCACRTP